MKITTRSLSRETLKYAQGVLDVRLISIDGEELTRLMIRYKVGVSTSRAFDVPELDENFFDNV